MQKILVTILVFFLISINLFTLSKAELKKMDPLLHNIYVNFLKENKNTENNSYFKLEESKGIIKVPVFIKTNYSRSQLESKNLKVNSFSNQIATSSLSRQQLETILKDKNIIRLEAGIKTQPLMETSTSDSTIIGSEGTVYIGNNTDSLQTVGRNGQDVIVAVIDNGINFSHKDFKDANGDTRVLYIWDQTTGESGSNHPTGFTYGTEYDSEDINTGTCYQSAGTHGNNCIGIAAGNGNDSPAGNDYTAMAPKADIIMIKRSPSDSDTYMEDAVSYIMNKADALGKPAVVSISLGSQYGPHDGTSLRNQAIDAECGPGKMVVFACGNSGSQRIHAETILAEGSDHSFDVDVVNDNFGVDIWLSGNDTLAISLDSPNLAEIGPFPHNSYIDTTTTDGRIQIWNCTDNPPNSDQHIVVYVTPDSLDNFGVGTWSIKLDGEHIEDGQIDAWSFTYNSNYFTSASGGNTDKTLNTIASGQNTIAAAGFYGGGRSGFDTGVIYSGSGRGPTRDNRQKPDIAGNQGVYVPVVNDSTGYTTAGAGTSYSAPHVAGAVALLFQTNPNLSPAKIHELLEDTANTDEYTDNAGTNPNYQCGYGKLNTYAAYKLLAEANVTQNVDSEVIVYSFHETGEETGIDIQFSDLTGTETINVKKYNNPPVEHSLSHQNISDYRWVIEGSGFASADLYFDSNYLPGITNPFTVNIYQREDEGSGSFDSLATSVSNDTIIVTVNSFSEFVLASNDNDNPLPVILASFNAVIENNAARLQWQTYSEQNNQGWNIYRNLSNNFSDAYKINADLIDGYGTTTSLSNYQYTDEMTLIDNNQYWYWLESIANNGQNTLFNPISIVYNNNEEPDSPEIPLVYGLQQNFPNPFNIDKTNKATTTIIPFRLENDERTKLSIYNIKGQLVKVLFDGEAKAKQLYNLNWNGKDSNNKEVSSGVYFYELESNNQLTRKKLLILK